LKKTIQKEGKPTIASLPSMWRQRAQDLRRWAAAEGAARALECVADELEAAVQHEGGEPLTLADAALASGYSADHLGRLVRRGKLPNHGRPNAPRVRPADLPYKSTGLPRPSGSGHIPRAEIARAVINRHAGGAR
jgi:hypothetical protein